MEKKRIYLGDGVYFIPDDYQCELLTFNGQVADSSIFIDHHVAEALIRELTKWLDVEVSDDKQRCSEL